MKTLFLLLISSFAFGAIESPFLSYDSKIDFDLNFNKNYNSHFGENNIELEIDDCVNVWLNCSAETIQYSAQVLPPGATITNGLVDINIYSGPTTKCLNGVTLYHGKNLPRTGGIPLSALNSLLCSNPLDYVTVNVTYRTPTQTCSTTKILELCN